MIFSVVGTPKAAAIKISSNSSQNAPPMTRQQVRMTGYTFTLSDQRARTELGYAPVVSWQEGIKAMNVATRNDNARSSRHRLNECAVAVLRTEVRLKLLRKLQILPDLEILVCDIEARVGTVDHLERCAVELQSQRVDQPKNIGTDRRR